MKANECDIFQQSSPIRGFNSFSKTSKQTNKQTKKQTIPGSLQTLLRRVQHVLTLKVIRTNSLAFSSFQNTERKCSATTSASIESPLFVHCNVVNSTASRHSSSCFTECRNSSFDVVTGANQIHH
jgi:hypothetical protein